MSRKILVRLIGAAFALVASNAAMACSTAAWSAATGGPVAGNPTAGDADGVVRRYSGLCGLKADAPGKFVRDESPENEASYRVRFSAFPSVTAGEAVIFEALDTGDAVRVRVTHDGTNFRFYNTNGSGGGSSVAAPAGRWYSIALTFQNGQPIAYSVKGNANDTPVPGTTGNATGAIFAARLGFVAAAAGAPTGSVEVDAFESRRTTDVPALCRGDANNSNSITASDRSAVTAELGGTLQVGQPDCNEDGNVTASDRSCLTARLAAGATCS